MKARDASIDNLRGVLILLVVLGHVLMGLEGMYPYPSQSEQVRSISLNFIYSFHMPAFFALSGYFFRSKEVQSVNSLWRSIRHKLITLGLPYVLCSVAYWGVKYACSSVLTAPVSIEQLLQIWKTPMEIMWYLYALFMINILAEIIDLVVKNKWILLILGVLVYYFISPHITSYILQQVCENIVYFYLGCILWQYRDYLAKWYIIIGTAMISGIVLFFTVSTSNYQAIFPVACAMIIFLLGVSQFFKKPIPILNRMGRDSMPIYVMHTLVIGAVRIGLTHFEITNIAIQIVAGFTIASFVCFGLYECILRRVAVFDFFFYPGKYIEKSKEKFTVVK